MSATELRQAYYDVLLRQVRSCRYPSPTMMQRTEEEIRDPDTAEEYIAALLELVGSDRYPSPQMLERISNTLVALDGS